MDKPVSCPVVPRFPHPPCPLEGTKWINEESGPEPVAVLRRELVRHYLAELPGSISASHEYQSIAWDEPPAGGQGTLPGGWAEFTS
jgi:hypothetical protein